MGKKIVLGIISALLVAVAFVMCFSAFFFVPTASAKEIVVVLDAGHGGVDGGVVGRTTKIKESDLNLQMAELMKEKLEGAGLTVVMTRKTKNGLYGHTGTGMKKRDMQKRKEIILSSSPSLVVSVHQNFYPSPKVRGGQVFYKKDDVFGQALATFIQEKLNGFYEDEGVKNRTITTGDFYILNCSKAPSVLIECGFLSNEKDEKLLTSGGTKKQLVSAIVSGILSYLTLEKSV